MPRDYICSLCSARYSYIPPDGCFCSEHKTTVIYDGLESKQLREKEDREHRLRQEQVQKEKREAEARAKANARPKPTPKPASKSSNDTGPTLGFITFIIVAAYIYFGMKEHYGIALGVGVVLGIIVRYTYKLIILVILLIAGYYIYTEYFEKDNSSTTTSSTLLYEIKKDTAELNSSFDIQPISSQLKRTTKNNS